MQPKIIYIKNIPTSYDEDTVRQPFSAYGKIIKTSCPIDKKTNLSKGYAFVTYEKYESAERALEKNDAEIDGEKIIVEYSKNQTINDLTSNSKTRKSNKID